MASPVVDFSEAPVTEHDADAVVMVVPLVSATTDDEWESLPGLRESLESIVQLNSAALRQARRRGR